jgi:hypothetical protein
MPVKPAVPAPPAPGQPRPAAAHVQAAVRAAQAKLPVAPAVPRPAVPGPVQAKAGPPVRPAAPHVRAAVAAVQKAPAPAPRVAAPHVAVAVRPVPPRTAPAAAQAKLAPQGAPGVIQPLPSNNTDPTTKADGVYLDRKETATVNGSKVPTRITAIMKKPPDGGRPSVSPPGWDWLQQHVQKLKGNWVRFHIINQYLGGPGNQAWNLVPTSVAVNNAFNREIEEPAKKSALTDDHWTYVDVELKYSAHWPAPIPSTILADWGDWDAGRRQWVLRGALPGPLRNPDITALGATVYRRGINIMVKDLADRGVPRDMQEGVMVFLRMYSQDDDNIDTLVETARTNFGRAFDDDWLDAIYLDEDDDNPGTYVPVVKAL